MAQDSVTSAPLLAARLRGGEPALIPTDTLPALAATPEHAQQLWALKRRPADKPLILMGADLEPLQEALGLAWRQEWLAMASVAWPGALTLVLPARGPAVESLNPGATSLGLRIPACAVTRELLRLSGPLATTSANVSGSPAATTAAAAAACFPGVPLLGPLPWPEAGGLASTVLAWSDSGAWQVLRAGAYLPPGLTP
ncbi:L-threonylcarbamoyladenylate synthase [Aphanothece stagnina]